MLANGAKLEYKKSGGNTYTELLGLKELPDMGTEPEKVDNTCLADKNKQYENGIGDAGEMQYKFKYDNKKTDSPYRILREAQAANETLSFKETLADGSVTEYDAQVSVKRTGGGVNAAIEFTVTMSLQSDLKFTDPTDETETTGE